MAIEENTQQPESGTEQNELPAGAPPQKRGRGRPPKNPDLIKEGISNATENAAKPKARKKQSGETDIAQLGKQLVGIHILASQLTGIPEFQIGPQEGDMLARGVLAVADQYDLAIDGKTGAALQLFAAAAMIYAPRVLAFQARAKKARENQATTVEFNEIPGQPAAH